MGTIRQRSNGTWFVDFIDARGARVRQRIGTGPEAKRLARKILAQRESEAVLGIHHLPAGRTPTFEEFALDWLERKRPPRVRPKTAGWYRDAVMRLLPVFGPRRLGTITREEIDAYLVSGQRARPHSAQQRKPPALLSPSTLNATLATLRAILADALEGGYLSTNPAARAKSLPEVLPPEGRVQSLTPAQMDALLAVAEEPYRTMYRLAIDAGLRRGEALALTWDDLDLANRRLWIRRSRIREYDGERYVVRDAPPKTRSSATVIDDLSPATIQALLALPAGDDPQRAYVFRNRDGGPLDPDNVSRVFERHRTAAGLPPLSFHALRHTCASLLINAGENIKAVQARMRHATAQMTLDVYGHLLPSVAQGMGARVEAWLDEQRLRHTQGTPGQERAEREPQQSAGTSVRSSD